MTDDLPEDRFTTTAAHVAQRERLAALLMQEVICEQIYREREKWDPEHPNRALGVRTIDPVALKPFITPNLLVLDKAALRSYAASVLDMINLAVNLAAAIPTDRLADKKYDDWCIATDAHGVDWIEVDGPCTRAEAIAQAVAYAQQRGWAPARIGWKREYTHADFVGGVGEYVRERLGDSACDAVSSDHASEYPDMKSEPFDQAIEAFVLDWLTKHADKPRFFSVEGTEEFPVPKETQ